MLRRASIVLFVGLAASTPACGGSSSETPPPLEPLPENLHYNRSATSLGGDEALESEVTDAGAPRASASDGAGAPPNASSGAEPAE